MPSWKRPVFGWTTMSVAEHFARMDAAIVLIRTQREALDRQMVQLRRVLEMVHALADGHTVTAAFLLAQIEDELKEIERG